MADIPDRVSYRELVKKYGVYTVAKAKRTAVNPWLPLTVTKSLVEEYCKFGVFAPQEVVNAARNRHRSRMSGRASIFKTPRSNPEKQP